MAIQTFGIGYGMQGDIKEGFMVDAVAVYTDNTFKLLPTIVVDNNRANENTVFLEPHSYFTKNGVKNRNTTFASHTVKRVIDDREVSILACDGLKENNFIHVVEVDTEDFPKGNVADNLYLLRVVVKPKNPQESWLEKGGFRLLEQDFQLGLTFLKTLKELKPSKAKKNFKSMLVKPKCKKALQEDVTFRQAVVELVDEVLAGVRFQLNEKVNAEEENAV